MPNLNTLSFTSESDLLMKETITIPAPVQERLGRLALIRIASALTGRPTKDFPVPTQYVELHPHHTASV